MEGEEKSKYSKLSIAAFVIFFVPIGIEIILLLVSFFNPFIIQHFSLYNLIILTPICSILSLIFSIVSLKIINKNNLKGKVFAIVSLILSIIFLFLELMVFLMVFNHITSS